MVLAAHARSGKKRVAGITVCAPRSSRGRLAGDLEAGTERGVTVYENGSRKGALRFVIKVSEKVRKVALAGDFNDWTPAAMRRCKDGIFRSTVPLSGSGTCEYKFLVDGQWIPDPDNNVWALNSHGTLNSVAQVEDEAPGAEYPARQCVKAGN